MKEFEHVARHVIESAYQDMEGVLGHRKGYVLRTDTLVEAILTAHQLDVERAVREARIEDSEYQYLTTYTGERIRFCSDCPQFKNKGGWEIHQCSGRDGCGLAQLTPSTDEEDK